jgi:superfamily II RNA helicase
MTSFVASIFNKTSHFASRQQSAAMVVKLCLVALVGVHVSGAFVLQDSRARRSSRLWEATATAEASSSINIGRERLQHYFEFPLDDWQLEAGGEIANGNNVIVCAPTGAGKTVVGQMALHIAVESGSKAIYTTPLKALSNQKFTELRQIFDKSKVGLATGDMSINRGTQITVMTTEVYRNMAWRSSGSRRNDEDHIVSLEETLLNSDELEDNAVCVLDEFHYMGVPGRGGVWEESVITSPSHTQIVGLSATLPNALQLASWMEGVTGRKTVLIEAKGCRPVPLRYLFAIREGLYPLFRDPDAGPGAPHGLLGLRCDGISPSAESKKKQNGFQSGEDDSVDDSFVSKKIPRGLHVNPALLAAAKQRIQRVNRAIDRQKVRETGRGGESDWDLGRKKMSPRDERRKREQLLRSEMRKAVPSLPVLLRRLEQKNLLPAIFFIFSRVGCEEAAETVCQFMRGPRDVFDCDVNDVDDDGTSPPQRKRKTRQRTKRRPQKNGDMLEDSKGRSFRKGSNYVSDDMLVSVFEQEITKRGTESYQNDSPLFSSDNWDFYSNAGLLRLSEVEEVAGRVAAFNENNEEIAFSDAEVERFLFGVGSHHAGMLSAHKAFVETLYRLQLMKAVFATETLAAGINMPARTTVVCALAKRGDKSTINLLETSNLLQMAGRAGRRGMDTDGTCVIVATPFEGHEDAALILTNEIKPIVSQFSPSYALAVNLIARGEGKLDIARQLVQKSFAMWEKRQIEDSIASAVDEHGNKVSEVMETAAQERFMALLTESLQLQIDKKSALFDRSKIQFLLDILTDHEHLKKKSKSYLAAVKMLELERTTMAYLECEEEQMESISADDDDQLLGDFLAEDQSEIIKQIDTQRKRVNKTEKEIAKHPFTSMAAYANQIMEDPEGKLLRDILSSARANDKYLYERNGPLLAEELSAYAKSTIVMKRKTRKLQTANPDLETAALLEQADRVEMMREDTWHDMLALTKVLVAYGCLSTEVSLEDDGSALESQTYHITQAGVNIGMLGFENSLWGLVAVGGAWDIAGVSASLDEFKAAMDDFESDFNFDDDDDESVTNESTDESSLLPKPQEEAETLLGQLRSLTPSEVAGYVSCLVSEGYRGSPSIVESFQRLSPRQQRVIQSSLLVLERLMEVQKHYSVDESSRRCNLELSNCEVVTAWAGGCTWNEALEISGAAPGDLVRTLGRALDTLRQLGNLPFSPVRASDMDGETVKTVSHGIHPEVRRLCRDAARAINRYPVKDPLPFDTEETEVEDEFEGGTSEQLESPPLNPVTDPLPFGMEETEVKDYF